MTNQVDRDNLYPKSGSHHTSQGRWFGGPEEFYSPTQPRGKDGRWKLSGSGSVSPAPTAVAIRAGYKSAHGLTDSADYSSITAPSVFRARVAQIYGKLPSYDKTAEKAYRSLINEVEQQYAAITKAGIKVQVVESDPYNTVEDLVRDINENKTLKVLSTASTGSHPFFTDEQNDMFRATHDFFGHAATGRDFGRHGERATYLAHADTMRNPDSVRALFTETEAQNATLIATKSFGEQKVGLFPDEIVFYGIKRPATSRVDN